MAPVSAKSYLEALRRSLPEGAYIATVSGRYYAMDRDNRWERVQLAYEALAQGKGYTATTAAEGIANAYDKGRTDEFIKPRVLGDYAGMADGDGILCLNFRADRAREILAAFADPDFDSFDTGKRPRFAIVSGFTEYSRRHSTYMDCIFPDERPANTLSEWVARQGQDPVPRRRDREIPPCHLLPERRQGSPRGWRRALHGPLPQGRDL